MHRLVNFNRETLPDSAVFSSAVSSAAFYGRGIFTTLAVRRGKPFLWSSHEKRLRANAAQIGIDVREINFAHIQSDLRELIKVNSINDGRARITLFDSQSSPLWPAEIKQKTDVLIVTAGERGKKSKNNLKLTSSPFPVNSASALTGVKSCNYLENILALERANKQNFDEAIRLNELGQVVSAIMANLFWIKEETIFTPDLQTGALGGTTREFVINLSKQSGFVVEETCALLKDLQTADEIFLTSAGLGVCPVESFDSQILRNKISSKIQTAFSEVINQ